MIIHFCIYPKNMFYIRMLYNIICAFMLCMCISMYSAYILSDLMCVCFTENQLYTSHTI